MTFLANQVSYSADPVEYDSGAHEMVFASVHIWLVSNYRAGAYEGQLAESWRSSKDFKTWTFQFRPGMKFENGDPITPKDLADSWLRLIRVLKARGSEADALKHLVGYRDFPKRAAAISGITYDERSLTLTFSEPAPKLLSYITFGLYGLVHPASYDRKTGAWLDPKRTVASGPYGIKEWDKNHMLLALRPDFPAALRHPLPLAEIYVRFESATNDEDLIQGSSRSEHASRGYEYHGGAANGINYFHIHSWRDPSSPFSRRAFRRRLRLAIYEELDKRELRPVRSFFPLVFKGVREMPTALSREDASYKVPPNASVRYTIGLSTEGMGGSGLALKAAVESLGMKFSLVSVPEEVILAEGRSKSVSSPDDLAPYGSGIDLDDPDIDIRFMIRSKEGINLPDPTGRLSAAIRRSPIDMQKVNEILWDDALIWPISHQSSGIWSRPEFDFSHVNILLPPSPLYLIGWKS